MQKKDEINLKTARGAPEDMNRLLQAIADLGGDSVIMTPSSIPNGHGGYSHCCGDITPLIADLAKRIVDWFQPSTKNRLILHIPFMPQHDLTAHQRIAAIATITDFMKANAESLGLTRSKLRTRLEALEIAALD